MAGSKKICLIFIFFFLFTLGSFVFAQKQLEVDYPELAGLKPAETTIDLGYYVKYVFNFGLAGAGLVALAVLIFAGFRYLTSVGSPVVAKDARDRIGAAALGLLILFGSYMILTTINPQLTFLEAPKILPLPRPEIDTSAIADKTFHYEEIPIGGLVGDMLGELRRIRIKNTLAGVDEAAKETKGLTEELKNLAEKEKKLAEDFKKNIDSCNCENTAVKVSSCIYKQPCPVSKGSYCAGGKYNGDPCPNKSLLFSLNSQIEQLKKEIFNKEKEVCQSIYNSAGLKTEKVDESCQKLYLPDNRVALEAILEYKKNKQGLVYWQKKLAIEIQRTAPEEKEKIAGLGKELADLAEAKKKIKNCSNSFSSREKTQQIFGYADFWQYRESLEKGKLIQAVDIKRPFDYIKADVSNPYYPATFYCAEEFYSTKDVIAEAEKAAKSINEEDVKAIQDEAEKIKEQRGITEEKEKNFCGLEIPIGKTINEAEILAAKLLGLLDGFQQKTESFFSSVITAINGAQGMVETKNLDEQITPENPGAKSLISEIKSDNCQSGCQEWIEPYEVCWYEPVEEGPPAKKCEMEPQECCVISSTGKAGISDGVSPGCSRYVPVLECRGTPGTKETIDPIGEISGATSQIINLYDAIDTIFTVLERSYDFSEPKGIVQIRKDTVGLIEKKKPLTAKTIIEKILEDLKTNAKEISACWNSLEKWQDVRENKKVILDRLFSCQQVRSPLSGIQEFIGKNKQDIKECYPPENEKEEKLDNYFCCKTETGF